MFLLKYFQLSSKPESLKVVYLQYAIFQYCCHHGNKEVKQVLDKADKPEKNSKRGAYEHFTPVDVVATNDGFYSVGAHQADYYNLVIIASLALASKLPADMIVGVAVGGLLVHMLSL